jgi:hypothetical protein
LHRTVEDQYKATLDGSIDFIAAHSEESAISGERNCPSHDALG